jgi:hypothetical protein
MTADISIQPLSLEVEANSCNTALMIGERASDINYSGARTVDM